MCVPDNKAVKTRLQTECTADKMLCMRVTRKQNILLWVMATQSEGVTKLGLQKRLFFLAEKEKKAGMVSTYDFYPHHRGCFSFTADYDFEKLREASYIYRENGRYALNTSLPLPDLPRADQRRIAQIAQETAGATDEELALRVYKEYPFYAINSKWATQLLAGDAETLRCIEENRPKCAKEGALFTIGYEGLSIESFFERLLKNGVTILCDVRRVPFSHKQGFSKYQLADLCHAMDFRYQHLPELGIASNRRRKLETQEDYDQLFDEYRQHDLPGMEPVLRRLVEQMEKGGRIALMCFEANIRQCHRRLLAERLEQISRFHATELTDSKLSPPCQLLFAC